jgi:alpha-1,3-mannosyltransferase
MTVTPLSMRGYDRVLACSEQDFQLFRPVTPADRLMVLDNGVDIGKFCDAASPDFTPSFLFIGRFAVNKGLDRLIEAFGEIASRIPEARLHIAGNDWGGLLPAMREQIARTPGGERIRITLDASDDDIRRLMRQCSLFISASHYEAFGLTAIEGMSAGLIPLTSDIDSYRAVIGPAGVGLISDFSQPREAGRAIADYVLACAPRHAELRAMAMAASREYDWPIVAERTTREYERVLGNRTEIAPA